MDSGSQWLVVAHSGHSRLWNKLKGFDVPWFHHFSFMVVHDSAMFYCRWNRSPLYYQKYDLLILCLVVDHWEGLEWEARQGREKRRVQYQAPREPGPPVMECTFYYVCTQVIGKIHVCYCWSMWSYLVLTIRNCRIHPFNRMPPYLIEFLLTCFTF